MIVRLHGNRDGNAAERDHGSRRNGELRGERGRRQACHQRGPVLATLPHRRRCSCAGKRRHRRRKAGRLLRLGRRRGGSEHALDRVVTEGCLE